MKSETLLVDPVLTAAYAIRLQARIRRLRALVREMEMTIYPDDADPISDHNIEREWYPTIERGDMTEE